MKFFIRLTLVSLCGIVAFCSSLYASEEEDFKTAYEAFRDDFHDASIALFEVFLRNYPESSHAPLAKLSLAKSFYFKNEYIRAFYMLRDLAAESDATCYRHEILFWLAQISFEREAYKDVISFSEEIVEAGQASLFFWQAQYLRAQAYFKNGAFEKAQQVLTSLIDSADDATLVNSAYKSMFEFYLTQRSYDAISVLARRYSKAYPDSRFVQTVDYYQAKSAFLEGRYDAAIDFYTKALSGMHDTHLADSIYKERGLCFLEKDSILEAFEDFKKITQRKHKLYVYGMYYMHIKDFPKALDNFTHFLEQYPENENVHAALLNKAECLYELGRIKDAQYAYRDLLNRFNSVSYDDVMGKARYGLAWCFLKEGKFAQALQSFQDCLAFAKKDVVKISARIQIAQVYQKQRDFTRAIDVYNDLLKQYPDTVYCDYIHFQKAMVYLELERWDDALVSLTALKEKYPDSTLLVQADYFIGFAYYSKQEYVKALNILKTFTIRYPADALTAKAQYLMSKSLASLDRFSDALASLQAVIANSADASLRELAHIDSAYILYKQHNYDDAKKMLAALLNTSENMKNAETAYYYLAKIYEAQDNIEQARFYYERIYAEYPKGRFFDEAVLSLGYIYFLKGDRDTAKTFLERAEEGAQTASSATFYLAKLYASEGNTEKAVAFYDKCIAFDDARSIDALNAKAYLLKDMKEYQAAAVLFKQVLERDPDNFPAHLALGFCFEKGNEVDKAIEQYEKVALIAKENDSVKAYFRLARLYEKVDDLSAARYAYQRIIAHECEESKIAKQRLKVLEKEIP